MIGATLERPIAILYTGTTATWCKGGCGRFRYPYCYVADRPYCEGCATIASIRAIVAPPAPEKAKPPKKQPKRRIGSKQLILEALSAGPASSRQLAAKLGLHQDTITTAAKWLIDRGMICAARESGGGSRSALWYALPEDIEKLRHQIATSLPEAVLRQLVTPKTTPELHKSLLNPATKCRYHLDSIKKALRQLIRERKVVQIDTAFSMYGSVTRFGKKEA